MFCSLYAPPEKVLTTACSFENQVLSKKYMNLRYFAELCIFFFSFLPDLETAIQHHDVQLR